MAAIDTSIYGRIGQGVKSVQDYQAEEQQQKANKLALMLGQTRLDEHQSGVQRQNRLQQLLGSGAQGEDLERSLLQGGFVDESSKLQNQRLNASRLQADTDRSALELSRERMGLLWNTFSGVADQASHSQARSALAAQGVDVSNIPEVYDPAQVEAAKRFALTQAQRLDQEWKQRGYDLQVRQQTETERAHRVGEGHQAQQLGLQRQRLAHDQQQPKGVYDAERGVIVDPRTGAATPVTLGGQPLPPKASAATQVTEGERNAAGYALRMDEATKLLGQYEEKGRAGYGTQVAGAVPLLGDTLRRGVMSKEQALYRQAADDWIRAKLRKESGAAIGADEMESEYRTYFPMPGDPPEVVAQKAQARAIANEAMRRSAGRGHAPMPEAPKPTPAAGSSAGNGRPSLDSFKKG